MSARSPTTRRARVRGGQLALALTLTLAALTALTGLAGTPASAASAASEPQIEREVMCPVCGVPLDLADSPQANREKDFIRGLIAQGRSESQIKQALVGQFGPAVLATPSHHGFGLTAYLVPPAIVLALISLLAVLLPRWRRRGRAPGEAAPAGALSPADAARLDEDLARFDA